MPLLLLRSDLHDSGSGDDEAGAPLLPVPPSASTSAAGSQRGTPRSSLASAFASAGGALLQRGMPSAAELGAPRRPAERRLSAAGPEPLALPVLRPVPRSATLAAAAEAEATAGASAATERAGAARSYAQSFRPAAHHAPRTVRQGTGGDVARSAAAGGGALLSGGALRSLRRSQRDSAVAQKAAVFEQLASLHSAAARGERGRASPPTQPQPSARSATGMAAPSASRLATTGGAATRSACASATASASGTPARPAWNACTRAECANRWHGSAQSSAACSPASPLATRARASAAGAATPPPQRSTPGSAGGRGAARRLCPAGCCDTARGPCACAAGPMLPALHARPGATSSVSVALEPLARGAAALPLPVAVARAVAGTAPDAAPLPAPPPAARVPAAPPPATPEPLAQPTHAVGCAAAESRWGATAAHPAAAVTAPQRPPSVLPSPEPEMQAECEGGSDELASPLPCASPDAGTEVPAGARAAFRSVASRRYAHAPAAEAALGADDSSSEGEGAAAAGEAALAPPPARAAFRSAASQRYTRAPPAGEPDGVDGLGDLAGAEEDSASEGESDGEGGAVGAAELAALAAADPGALASLERLSRQRFGMSLAELAAEPSATPRDLPSREPSATSSTARSRLRALGKSFGRLFSTRSSRRGGEPGDDAASEASAAASARGPGSTAGSSTSGWTSLTAPAGGAEARARKKLWKRAARKIGAWRGGTGVSPMAGVVVRSPNRLELTRAVPRAGPLQARCWASLRATRRPWLDLSALHSSP